MSIVKLTSESDVFSTCYVFHPPPSYHPFQIAKQKTQTVLDSKVAVLQSALRAQLDQLR